MISTLEAQLEFRTKEVETLKDEKRELQVSILIRIRILS